MKKRNIRSSSRSSSPLKREKGIIDFLKEYNPLYGYTSHDKDNIDFSPLHLAREDGRVVLDPRGNSEDIKKDSRYIDFKKKAYQASPYVKQLNDLQQRRNLWLQKDQRPTITLSFQNQEGGIYYPRTKEMLVYANPKMKNPLSTVIHEGQHALSYADIQNKAHDKTLSNIKKQGLNNSQLNRARSKIDRLGNFEKYYDLPEELPTELPSPRLNKTSFKEELLNFKKSLEKTRGNADEFGTHILQNVEGPMEFRNIEPDIQPFLHQEINNIADIYRMYDKEKHFPQVHKTLNKALKKTMPVKKIEFEKDVYKDARHKQRQRRQQSHRPSPKTFEEYKVIDQD